MSLWEKACTLVGCVREAQVEGSPAVGPAADQAAEAERGAECPHAASPHTSSRHGIRAVAEHLVRRSLWQYCTCSRVTAASWQCASARWRRRAQACGV